MCSSAEIVEAFPEIPTLDNDPGLAVVVAVEGEIPRTENGTILHREMVAWLRFHGVRDRAEILTWEYFFREIGHMRARIVEELTAVTTKGDSEEREE